MPPSFIIKMVDSFFFHKSNNKKKRNEMEVKLYVGNLSYDTTADELRAMFAEAGAVSNVELIKDRDTGTSKGFAFITMGSQADAAKAITMFNSKDMGGRLLKVNTAKAREDRPGGGQSYNNNRGGPKRRY
jgi:RNA recognition motif-containing protein